MFADPAEARFLSPGFLHNGAGIDIVARVGFWRHPANPVIELLQPITDDRVIVLPPGVPSNAAIARLFTGTMLGQVVDSDRDNRAAFRKDLPGIGAPLRPLSHPCHRTVEPAFKPLCEACEKRVVPWRVRSIDARDANGIEPQRTGFVLDRPRKGSVEHELLPGRTM